MELYTPLNWNVLPLALQQCISVRSQHISYACFEWLTPFKLGCALAVLAKIIEMIDYGYMEEKPSPFGCNSRKRPFMMIIPECAVELPDCARREFAARDVYVVFIHGSRVMVAGIDGEWGEVFPFWWLRQRISRTKQRT